MFFKFHGISWTCSSERTGFWWCQVSLVSVVYVRMLHSHHLVISIATCPCYLWRELVPSVILFFFFLFFFVFVFVRSPQSLAISMILWFCNLVILSFWVFQRSWNSRCLWNPEILVWPCSWDPVILGLLELLWSWTFRGPWSRASSGCCGTVCEASAQGLEYTSCWYLNICYADKWLCKILHSITLSPQVYLFFDKQL